MNIEVCALSTKSCISIFFSLPKMIEYLLYQSSKCTSNATYIFKNFWAFNLTYIRLRRTYSIKKILFFRNSPVNCDVFPQLNLHYWKTDSPALQVPEAILIQTLEKGTQGLAQRRKEEYKLWELSKKYVLFFS